MLKLDEIQKMLEGETVTNSAGKQVFVNRIRESNRKAVLKSLWENPEIKFMRESFQRKHGFDFADRTKFPVDQPGFNWNKVAQKCGAPNVTMALREADSASNFVGVLRAGVQTIVNQSYETVATTFESWCHVVQSKMDTEAYAPLHGISFLREVGKQELYGESRAAGLDLKLVNRKYGTLFSVEKELLEDDQTGQFQQQAGLLGEYAKLAIECIVMAKLAGKFTGGALATYAELVIPPTETQPSNEAIYPWTPPATPFIGGGSNRPASYTVIGQAAIQAGFIALMNQKNLLGLKMSVDPNRLIIGPQEKFNAAVLLNSSFYPSGTAQATAGSIGNVMAINPIEAIAALTVSRFMFKNDATVDGTSKAWYLIDDKKPWFVAQIRQAAEVSQENPNAGESFNRDVIRFKVSLRANSDVIDPRFAYQGNDGSVTS